MPLYRDEAVVLRTHKLGESDRIITMLSRNSGVLRAVAKGVRRTSSRWGARLEPFTHVDVQLAEGRTLDTITQAESLTSFGARLGADYERYTAGMVMLETAQQLVVEERQPSVQQFLLLIGGLRAMNDGVLRPAQVLDSYLLRSLSVAGFAPCFDRCAQCGVDGPLVFFSPGAGGALCRECRNPSSAVPNPATLELMGDLLAGDWVAVDAAEARVLREASRLVAAYATWHLERSLRSLPLVDRTEQAGA